MKPSGLQVPEEGLMGSFIWSCTKNTMYLAQCREGTLKVQSNEFRHKLPDKCWNVFSKITHGLENLKNLQEAEPVDKNMQMVVVLAACQSPPLVLMDRQGRGSGGLTFGPGVTLGMSRFPSSRAARLDTRVSVWARSSARMVSPCSRIPFTPGFLRARRTNPTPTLLA
ncbi:hypothetical protein PAL_GLEAN10007079 [Pteropus alecto]|uniref:Uncharacterized protein n=1 Tax=Pteropus alecto TaxID=9402 RepID=L5L011_PTEAL|nr:hypothetical protein PAL_GLEAN10007079 [Pteropus alecto]